VHPATLEVVQLMSGYPTNYAMLAACHAHVGQSAEARDAAVRFREASGMDVRDYAHRVGATHWMRSRLARIESDG
jgi:hypothetical protein